MEVRKMPTREHNTTAKPRWRRAIVASSVVFSLVAGGFVMLPTVLNHTSYRNRVLNTAFEKYGLTGSSATASGGWLVPLGFQDIRISDADGLVNVHIQEIRTSRSLLGLFSSGEDLGTLTLVNPVVEVSLDDQGRLPIARPDEVPAAVNVAFEIENGAFKLSVPWRKLPIVDLAGLDISGALEQRSDGRWLTVEPVQVFDRERLSEAHSEQNLALIAPVLSQTTRVSGEASVWMDGVQLRLDPENGSFSPFPLTGHAVFHHVDARLRPEWANQIAALVGQIAERNVPDRLEIVRDSRVDFQFTNEGIRHQGLGLLLPDLASQMQIESSGLVGLDERLDLNLAVRAAGTTVGSASWLGTLTNLMASPLQFRVTGTVSNPALVPPGGGTWLDEVSRKVAPDQHTPEPPPVRQAVMEVIQKTAAAEASPAARQDLPGSILGLIRAVKQQKAAEQQTPLTPPAPRQTSPQLAPAPPE